MKSRSYFIVALSVPLLIATKAVLATETVDEDGGLRIGAAIVIADDKQRIGLVVVDSCMIPKELIDDAKHRAAKRTKFPCTFQTHAEA